LASYFLVRRLAKSVRTLDHWSAVDRPHYLAGVLAAADQALRENVPGISVYEFGVAGGNGLVALQSYAELVEQEIGVTVQVFGFDSGSGLPDMSGDYRDHPDQWRPGDYKMDVPKLRQRLTPRTSLILGKISETLSRFFTEDRAPIGFVACDVDLYSSAKDVLQLFALPGAKMLRRVPMYFDDIDVFYNHRFAGELLAIDEFNASAVPVRIDIWRGVKKGRVFVDEPWLEKMFVAHDLEAISNCILTRSPSNDLQLN
jgi:hypothetical protein